MNSFTIALIAIISIHIIGAITTLIVHYKNGTFKFAVENGDGIRYARPSDVLFMDCVVWEMLLLVDLLTIIDNIIYDFFERRI